MKLNLLFSLILIFSAKILSCDYFCPALELFTIDTISEGTVRKINFPPVPFPYILPFSDSLFKDTVSIDTYSVATIDSIFHYYYNNSDFVFSGKILSDKRYRTDTALVGSCCSLCICHHKYTYYDSINYQVKDCFKGNILTGDILHFYFIKDYYDHFGGECDLNQGYNYVENSLIFNNGKDGLFPYQLHSDDFTDRECGTEKIIGWWFNYNNLDSSLSLRDYPGVSIKIKDALNSSSKMSPYTKLSFPLNISFFRSGSSLIFRFSEPLNSADISVFDLSGKLIFRDKNVYGSKYILDIKGTPKGCYIFDLRINKHAIGKYFRFLIK